MVCHCEKIFYNHVLDAPDPFVQGGENKENKVTSSDS